MVTKLMILVLLLVAAASLDAAQAMKGNGQGKQADGSVDDCSHRLVPLSWDKNRATIDWSITLTLVFGGKRGLLVKGYEECDAVIAKWKDNINKHTNCKIDGMEVSEDQDDWSEWDHAGFYLDREVGQQKVDLTRASVTYLKVNKTKLPFMPNEYFGKYFRLSTSECGTFNTIGCLVFRIEEDKLISDNCASYEDVQDVDNDHDEVSKDCGSKKSCSGKSDEGGLSDDDGATDSGDDDKDKSDGHEENGDDGDKDDGEVSDGDEDGEPDDNVDPDGGGGGTGDDIGENNSTPAGNTSSVIDPGGEGTDGSADGSSVAPAAVAASVLTLLAVLAIGGVIAAMAIYRRRQSGLNSMKSDAFSNPDYGEVQGGGKNALQNPAYGNISGNVNGAFSNPTYGDVIVPSSQDALSEPIYSSLDTPEDEEENIYAEI